MEMDEVVWNHAVYSKNRERLQKLRGMNITPHVAQNTTNRRSAIERKLKTENEKTSKTKFFNKRQP
jgi:hypothetical protein